MPKAYWVTCHRQTKSPGRFAAFTKLACPAIQPAGGRFLVRASNAAKACESGLYDRTVVIEFENLAKALAAYDTSRPSGRAARTGRRCGPRPAHR